MKTNKSNPLKSQAEQMKILLALDRKTNLEFLTAEQRKNPKFLARFKKFVRTGKL
jgi:hypothetical protein